ncbi:MAG: hypothetical protein O7B99_14930 [Planctomycetota bacterium]|nr:hypothetical protein [Planctomycetota bacterium]
MKLLNPSAVLAAAGLSVFSAGTRLEFAPTEGEVLTKTFESKFEGKLESVTFPNDENVSVGDVDVAFLQRLRVTDRYVAMGSGRPDELQRAYDEIRRTAAFQGQFMGGDQEAETEGRSELEGKTVLFTWDEKRRRYHTEFEESGPHLDLLRDLVEDTDLRRFLPPDEVEEDETWKLEAGVLRDLFFAGGDLKIETKGGPGELLERAAEDLEGEIVCSFWGTEGAGTLAIIEMQGDVSAEAEEERQTEFGPSWRRIQFGWRFKGELVWDLERGHFRSLELEGDLTGSMEGTSPSKEYSWDWRTSLSGKVTVTASATTEDC